VSNPEAEVCVRRAMVVDIKDLARAWFYFTKQKGYEYPDWESWAVATAALITGNSDYICYVAEQDGKFLGFIDGMIHYEPSHSEYVVIGRHSWVYETERNKGVGSLLYDAFIKWAENRGASRIWTQSLPDGDSARRMAKKLTGKDMTLFQETWEFEIQGE